MSERNETLASVRNKIADYLQPAKNKGSYICPICGSGTGPNKTGAMHVRKDNVHCKCFACGFYGDIFDLVGKQHGLDARASYEKVLEWAGAGKNSTVYVQQTSKPALKVRLADTNAAVTQAADFEEYVRRCGEALRKSPSALRYLQGRGLTEETIARFMLGYDAGARQVVVPYGPGCRYYIRRGVGEDKVFYKPPAAQAGPEPVFNAVALGGTAGCVFVVESPFCAMAIEQAGGHAVAIGGTGGHKLLARMAEQPTEAVLALSLDNDARGQAAQAQLLQALAERGIPAVACNVAGMWKDPNEALQQEPAAFAERVGEMARRAAGQKDALARQQLADYQAGSVGSYLDDFVAGVATRAQTPAVPTGFAALDASLDGGLYEGLYVLGALSSLGKTSFALQMADQIAQQGRDVLFFSLEMARSELMAKSISRHTWLADGPQGKQAKSARDITNTARHAGFTEDEQALMKRAVTAYAQYAQHLYIVEADEPLGTREVAARVAEHVAITGTAPVVFVDYLQILAPAEPRATDKQNTDRAVFDLKRLSRQYKVPVFAISSLNRENYGASLTMSAFKESGAIEYSSDVLLGLQFALGPGEDRLSQERLDALKRQVPRPLELVVLKNRNGPAGERLGLGYWAAYNGFGEMDVAKGKGGRR